MAYRAGQAYIDVVPSFRGFQKTVRRRLREELDQIKVPMRPELDERDAERAGERGGEVAGGAFERQFRKRVDRAIESLPDIEVDADTTMAEMQIASLREHLQRLRDQRIGVDLDAAQANAQINAIRSELERLSHDDARVDVRVDAATASAALAAVEAQADRLDGKNVDIDVDTRGSAAATANSVRFLAQEMNALILAGMAIAPALVPALGAVTIAAGGLASALAGAGAGLGGLFVAALPAITNVTEAVQQQELAQKSAFTNASQLARQQVSNAQAAQQAARRVADAQRTADRTAVEGARQVADAQQGVTDARVRAADMILQAQRRVEDAERSLTRAQAEQRQAQIELTRAREDAVRALEDMRERTTDLALSEESAEIALIEARQRQAEVEANANSTALDRRKAALAVAEAEDRLSDVRRDQQRHTKDLNDAERAGVNGSEQVVAAQRRLANASQSVADAQRDSRQAQADLARAQADAARVVQAAEQELADARVQAAQANADASRAVADALDAQAHQAQMANMQMEQGTAAQRNYAYALQQLTPMQRVLMRGFLDLKEAFLAWTTALEPAIIPLFVQGMKLLQQIMPLLTPIVLATAAALDGLLRSAEKALQSPFWQEFFDFLARTAGPNTEAFGTILGNLATMFAGLLMAFEPVAEDIMAGLVKLTGRWAEWGATLDENQSFQNFVDYIREHWPAVQAMLAAMADAFVAIIKAMAPLAGPTLQVLTQIFEVIAWLPPPVLAGLAIGFIAIASAVKIWSIAQAGLNLAMKRFPLILVITLLSQLIAWLISAYQTNETFRAVVDKVAAAIVTAYAWLGKAVGWLRDVFVAAFQWVRDKAIWLKDGVVGALAALGAGALAAWEWFDRNVITPFVDGLIWLKNRAVSIKDSIVEAFKAIPGLLSGVFGGLWDVLKIPLNKVFGFINDYMIAPLNLILKPFDLEIPDLPKLHTGGAVPGTGEKPYMLLGGEGVLNRDAMAAIGGEATLDAWNSGRVAPGANDPTAMGGPFDFDWPDWASWDTVKQGLAIGADVATGKAGVEGLSEGLLAGIEKIIDYVNDHIKPIIPGPPFADVPVEEKIEDYGEALLRWAKYGHSKIEAPKTGGTLGKPGGKPSFQGNWAFPLPRGSYRVGGGIGSYPGHNGQDFPAPIGTPVFAPFGGWFTGVNLGNRSYGTYADVRAGPWRAVMAHLSALVGGSRMVKAGDLVGRVGSTGNSTGPHLHLTIERNGGTVNPRSVLSYDSGGYLNPGLSLAYNGTGVRERVLDPAETGAYERGFGDNVQVYAYGSPKSLVNEVAFTLQARRHARRPVLRG